MRHPCIMHCIVVLFARISVALSMELHRIRCGIIYEALQTLMHSTKCCFSSNCNIFQ
jgi:hypothetical protein